MIHPVSHIRPFETVSSKLGFSRSLKRRCSHQDQFTMGNCEQASQLLAPNTTFDLPLPHRISVAPMVDVSSPHFLYLLRLIGGPKPQLYTEMYHSKAIISFQENGILDFRLGLNQYSPRQIHTSLFSRPLDGSLLSSIGKGMDKETEEIFGKLEKRDNTVVQIGGSDPESLAQATAILEKQREYSAINLNLGCPSPAVQAGDFGAALMKDVDRVVDCVQAMEATGRNITVKCRLGVDELDSEEFILGFVGIDLNSPKFCQVETLSSKTQVTHFIIHARKCLLKGLSPAKNRTIPPLDYDRVLLLARAFPHLSFTLNGGIRSLEEAHNHLAANINGIMLGRKIMENPSFLMPLVKEFLDPSFTPLPHPMIYACYVEYMLDQLNRGHRPTILIKPTMYLFPGKQGRDYRSKLIQVPSLRSYNPQQPYSPETDGVTIRKELLRLINP